jgi:hypothetical protein
MKRWVWIGVVAVLVADIVGVGIAGSGRREAESGKRRCPRKLANRHE